VSGLVQHLLAGCSLRTIQSNSHLMACLLLGLQDAEATDTVLPVTYPQLHNMVEKGGAWAGCRCESSHNFSALGGRGVQGCHLGVVSSLVWACPDKEPAMDATELMQTASYCLPTVSVPCAACLQTPSTLAGVQAPTTSSCHVAACPELPAQQPA
jgi:hypothetical protein